jgi:hypothetical protein
MPSDSHHIISLIRILFPSWNFFNRFGFTTRLYFRTNYLLELSPQLQPNDLESKVKFGPWMPAIANPKRGWSSFFLNPDGNACLAVYSILERFVIEINESKPGSDASGDISQSVSYQLIESFIRMNLSMTITATKCDTESLTKGTSEISAKSTSEITPEIAKQNKFQFKICIDKAKPQTESASSNVADEHELLISLEHEV